MTKKSNTLETKTAFIYKQKPHGNRQFSRQSRKEKEQMLTIIRNLQKPKIYRGEINAFFSDDEK